MNHRLALVTVPVLLGALACAPVEENDDPVADPAASGSSSAAPAACETDDLALREDGVLTVGTDSPAFEPWFSDDDPTNGKGFESAVAYAVAKELGFERDAVKWTTVPFNSSFAPGAKDFDFDINQISILPERAEVVDFSTGYYSAAQAVVTLEDSPVADVTSIADLADYNLGAQTGTTSLTAIREVIKPANKPQVFETTAAAKEDLLNGRVDAIIADLPTAFYISAAEIEGSAVVGQFQPETGEQEEFGLLLEKGSELTPCLDAALAALRADGTLAAIEKEWLSDVVGVPELS